ncbi:MAG TPA: hypothetical protein VGQ59_06320 [Cyclobacteriaceae bacterium]|jgi:high-affinity Fe2+/Pb2+ permease|nr:hypothetical protein [Cyclobacteriaceae bacterium]
MNFILGLITLIVVSILLMALLHKKDDNDHENKDSKYSPGVSGGNLKTNKTRNPYSF